MRYYYGETRSVRKLKYMRSLGFLSRFTRRFRKDKSGAVPAEYAFLLVFIAIVAVAGMVVMGPNLSFFFSQVGNTVPNTAADPPCPLGGC